MLGPKRVGEEPSQCFCVGPRPGEPLCPCAMRSVDSINGRYVMPARDLGPVSAITEETKAYFGAWNDHILANSKGA